MTVAEDAAMTALRGRRWLGQWGGRRVVVAGLGRSGLAAARLMRAAGADVAAVDRRPAGALAAEAAELRAIGARLVAGDPAPALRAADLVVASPGIPRESPELAPAIAAGARVLGELEVGWRALESDAIAITGTNGKTTTTALAGALLAGGGRPVAVAGNIGTPLSGLWDSLPPTGLLVLEASSFQLETIDAFHPRVAVVLNVTPDHLDRHGTFAAYLEAKARILANQAADDWTVLNADDPVVAGLAGRTRGRVVWFSRRQPLAEGLVVEDGWLVAALGGRRTRVAPVTELELRGAHNVENALAALACALWAGAAPAELRTRLGAFRAVPHRIEHVRTLEGAAYYNDSKGTNVASTVTALESFAEPIVLIAGGLGKGQDWVPLAEAARGRVTDAVVIGRDGPEIGAALAAAGVRVASAADLSAAVACARDRARPGSVVLFSPAAASFDMFRNFEHRGDEFRRIVGELA